MAWDLQWHDEVDVVCADAGMAGLACAISAVDGGAEVLVAGSPDPRVSGAGGDRLKWFGLDGDDADTLAYLADLTEGLDPARIPESADVLPIRLTAQPPALKGRRIPAFVGSRLAIGPLAASLLHRVTCTPASPNGPRRRWNPSTVTSSRWPRSVR